MGSGILATVATFLLMANLLQAGAAAGARLRGIDTREVMRLISRVRPETCRCDLDYNCDVRVPNTHLIGIDCNKMMSAPPTAKVAFCCEARSFIKPFVTPADLAAVHAAAKRLNIRRNYVERVAVTPAVTPVNNATEAAVPTTTTTSTGTVHQVLPQQEEQQVKETTRVCECVSTWKCPAELMDLAFGKSCKFGKTRCCFPASLTTTPPPTTTTITTTTTTKKAPSYHRHSVPLNYYKYAPPPRAPLQHNSMLNSVRRINTFRPRYQHRIEHKITNDEILSGPRAQNRNIKIAPEEPTPERQQTQVTQERQKYEQYVRHQRYMAEMKRLEERQQQLQSPSLVQRITNAFASFRQVIASYITG